MKYRVRFRSLARADVRRELRRYGHEAPHMVASFSEELDAVVASLEENPQIYQSVYRESRRALMARFPYSIYFLVEENLVIVFAVVHQSRDDER